VHLKLSERTRHVVAREELSVMKKTAFLVNTSRGPLVAEEALIDALRSRRIAGAALDAFDIEPLPPGHPYRTLPNVLATPHVGYVTEATYEVFYRQMAEDVRAWLDGRPVRRIISGSTAGETALSIASNVAASQ
jgi:phosphoglycerate dehydrogenase-like enzyme